MKHWSCTNSIYTKLQICCNALFPYWLAFPACLVRAVVLWLYNMAACCRFGVNLSNQHDHQSHSRLTDGIFFFACLLVALLLDESILSPNSASLFPQLGEYYSMSNCQFSFLFFWKISFQVHFSIPSSPLLNKIILSPISDSWSFFQDKFNQKNALDAFHTQLMKIFLGQNQPANLLRSSEIPLSQVRKTRKIFLTI